MYWVLLIFIYTGCVHGDDIQPNEGDVRITGGPTAYEGYIQIYHAGSYGTICALVYKKFHFRVCSVACRSLNYNNCFNYMHYKAEHIQNNVIVLDEVKCRGDEINLMNCSHRGWGNISDTCLTDGIVDGVVCSNTTLDIRLINGHYPYEGRVELLYDGQWRRICIDRWGIVDAQVACYQAGYVSAVEAVTEQRFGPVNELPPPLAEFFSCWSTEPTLSECMHSGFNRDFRSCEVSAGVVCTNVLRDDFISKTSPSGIPTTLDGNDVVQIVDDIISEQLDELEELEEDTIQYFTTDGGAEGLLLKSSSSSVNLTYISTDQDSIAFSIETDPNTNESIGVIVSVLKFSNISSLITLNDGLNSVASDLVSVVLFDSNGNTISRTNTTILFPLIQVSGVNETLEPVCAFIDEVAYPWQWSTDGCDTILPDDYFAHGITCLCRHLTSFAILMRTKESHVGETEEAGLHMITYIGLCSSTVFLLFTIGTISWLSDLRRSQRYKKLRHLVVSLFCTNCTFCLITFEVKNRIACSIIAACLHYCLLVAFSWMTFMSTDMYMCIQYVFHDPEKRFTYFRLFGWILPLLFVAIVVAITGENYSSESCWLNVDNGVTWTFIGPVILSILIVSVQLIIIGHVAYTKARMPHQSDEQKDKLKQIRSLLYRILLLTPVVGLTWIFGIFTLFNTSVVLQYLFVISTSMQGFLIWFTQCFLSKEVNEAWRKFHNQHSGIVDVSTEMTTP